MKELLRYSIAIAGVFAASIVLFLACYGIATIFSSGEKFNLRPNDAAAFAGWIQAVGSIAAIVGAFVLGHWQAQTSRNTALELERTREDNRLNGLAGVYIHLLKLSYNTLRLAQEATPHAFPDQWKTISSWLQTAIDASSQLPLHDLGTPERIFCAVRIRGLATDTYKLAAAAADKAPTFNTAKLADDLQFSNVVDLHLAELAKLREEHLSLYR